MGVQKMTDAITNIPRIMTINREDETSQTDEIPHSLNNKSNHQFSICP